MTERSQEYEEIRDVARSLSVAMQYLHAASISHGSRTVTHWSAINNARSTWLKMNMCIKVVKVALCKIL